MIASLNPQLGENQPTEAHSISGSKLLAGATSLSASQVMRRAFRTLFLLFAARIMGPEIFGLYVLLFTITEIVALVSGGGFGDYLTREVAKSPASGRQLLLRVIQLHFSYRVLLVMLAIPGLALFRYSPSTLMNAALLLLTLFPRGAIESSQGVMRAMHRFRPILWVELLQGAVLLGIGASLLLRGHGLRGVIWGELIAALAGAAAALPIAVQLSHSGGRNSFGWVWLIRETIAFNVYPLIASTYDRIDVVLLSKLAGNAAVGIYSLPYRTFAALSILPYGVMGTLLPSLAKSAWNEDERERCGMMMQLLYAAALFFILGAMLLADPAVRLLLGPGYQGSAEVLKTLAWATVPVFLNFALNTILLAKNRERVFLRTASVCTVVNVAANVLLIPRYSYIAAAAVTILTELVLLGQNLALVHKVLGYMPLPGRALRNSLVFLALLVAGRQATQFLPSLAVAAAALAIFASYLRVSGSLSWFTQSGGTAYAA